MGVGEGAYVCLYACVCVEGDGRRGEGVEGGILKPETRDK